VAQGVAQVTPTRVDVINRLATLVGAKSYLEIGVSDGQCFRLVQVAEKESVDPYPGLATHQQTSDEFFSTVDPTRRWDLIFVDGYHERAQALRDIQNALERLNPGGAIVVHDCDPKTEDMQRVPNVQDEWTGDVWKAWAQLRSKRADLQMCVVDTDYGCGVIRKGSQKRIEPGPLDWTTFVARRKELLNLISWDDWLLSLQPTATRESRPWRKKRW
jgi:hypothetical protein